MKNILWAAIWFVVLIVVVIFGRHSIKHNVDPEALTQNKVSIDFSIGSKTYTLAGTIDH